MILVGIHYCHFCKIYHEEHPEIVYIEIPVSCKGLWHTPEARAKKACGKLKVAGFPVLLNDDMTAVVRYPGGFKRVFKGTRSRPKLLPTREVTVR